MTDTSQIDITSLTTEEIEKLQENLTGFLSERKTKERESAFKQIQLIMENRNISPEDITEHFKKDSKVKKPKNKGVPKYKDPASNATWTGKGRKPQWYLDLEAQGKDMAGFLI